jgi:hypothetical protein
MTASEGRYPIGGHVDPVADHGSPRAVDVLSDPAFVQNL